MPDLFETLAAMALEKLPVLRPLAPLPFSPRHGAGGLVEIEAFEEASLRPTAGTTAPAMARPPANSSVRLPQVRVPAVPLQTQEETEAGGTSTRPVGQLIAPDTSPTPGQGARANVAQEQTAGRAAAPGEKPPLAQIRPSVIPDLPQDRRQAGPRPAQHHSAPGESANFATYSPQAHFAPPLQSPAQGPRITVSIGRVEIKATLPPPAPKPAPRLGPAAPGLSLSEYLKRPHGGRE